MGAGRVHLTVAHFIDGFTDGTICPIRNAPEFAGQVLVCRSK